MKKAFIAAAVIAGIIAVRMILSASLSEQAAEVFTRVSCIALFFYCVISISRSRRIAQKIENNTQ